MLYRFAETPVTDATIDVRVAAHGSLAVSDAEVLGRFADVTYAYRFGPPGHNLVVATLLDAEGVKHLGKAFHIVRGSGGWVTPEPEVEALAEQSGSDWRIAVRSRRFARAVAVDAPGFVADDDFFDVEPGGEHAVILRGAGDLRASVKPVNAAFPTKVQTRLEVGRDALDGVTGHRAAPSHRPTGG